MNAIGNIFFVATNIGLLKSENLGLTWALDGSLPQWDFRKIEVKGNAIFLAGTQGLFLSLDAGKTWTFESGGNIQNKQIYSLCLTPNKRFVGTFANGVYSLPVSNYIPAKPSVPVGSATICFNQGNSTYSVPAIDYAASYQWTLSPSSAGVITGSTNSISVDWNNTFTGTASLSVVAQNDLGISTNSDALNITVGSLQGPNISISCSDADQIVTQGDLVTFTATGADTYRFSINNSWVTDELASNTYITSALTHGASISVTGYKNGCSVTSQALRLKVDLSASWQYTGGPEGFYLTEAVGNLEGNLFVCNYPNGILKSTDNGITWKLVYTAGYWMHNFYANNGIYYSTAYNNIFYSTDKGESWKVFANTTNGLPNTDVLSLAFNGTTVYAGLSNGTVYSSTNNGVLWTSTTNAPTTTGIYILGYNQGKLFAGAQNGELLISSDNGVIWNKSSQFPSLFCNFNSIYFSGNTVMLSSCNGVYLSKDNGANWNRTSLNTSTNFAFYGNTLFSGSYSGRIKASYDNGLSWQDITASSFSTSGDSRVMISGNNLIAVLQNGFYSCSLTDNKFIWKEISTSIPRSSQNLMVDGTNVYACTDYGGIYYQNDEFTWKNARTGLVDYYSYAMKKIGNTIFSLNCNTQYTNDINTPWQRIKNSLGCLYWIEEKGGLIYTGVYNGDIYKSSDNGTTWVKIGNTGNTASNLKKLIFKGNTLFALYDYVSSTNIYPLYKSTDLGITWTACNISNTSASNYFDIVTDGTNIYLGTNMGVFKSFDDGSTWTNYKTGLSSAYVQRIEILGSSIIVGTTNGIYLSGDGAATFTAINTGLPSAPNIYGIGYNSRKIYISTNKGIYSRLMTDFAPAKPVISGTDKTFCTTNPPNSTYSITTPITGATYEWSISPSTAGTISLTGTSTTVNWNDTYAGSATITAIGKNGFGYGITSDAFLVVIASNPTAAGTISGSNTVCQGTSMFYSVDEILNATEYVWTYPTGTTATNNGKILKLLFPTTAVSGTVTVKGKNSCAEGIVSPTFNITVNPLPSYSSTISGAKEICQDSISSEFSVSNPLNTQSYQWTISPASAAIISSSVTQTIIADWSSSYISFVDFRVKGINACGIGPEILHSINIRPNPTKPTLLLKGTKILICIDSGMPSYIWYKNSVAITEAKKQYLVLPEGNQGGNYTVKTKNVYGCTSTSDSRLMLQDIPDLNSSINIYPNPGNGNATIEMNNTIQGKFKLKISDYLGTPLNMMQLEKQEQYWYNPILFSGYKPGVYLLEFIFENGQRSYKKMVIQ